MTKDERIAGAASDMGFDDPQHLLEFLEGQGLTVMVKDEPDDHDEALIEQLDEALCTMLHDGGEVGEHSPRTHLQLFYNRQKACVGCTKHTTWDDCPVHAPAVRAKAKGKDREVFVHRAAIAFATHPQYNEGRDGSGAYVMLPYLLTPSDAVREAVALWDAVQKALTE